MDVPSLVFDKFPFYVYIKKCKGPKIVPLGTPSLFAYNQNETFSIKNILQFYLGSVKPEI